MNKQARLLVLGLALLPIVVIANIARGQADIGFGTVLRVLAHSRHSTEYEVIMNFRLPRALVGLLAGAALALVGALLQTTLRNSLVSAGTLGIHAGAYLTAVAATVFLPAWVGRYPLLLTFAGGLLAVALVYALAGRTSHSPLRMVLSGLIVTMLLGSATNMIQILFENETRQLLIWGNGSLAQNDWTTVRSVWAPIAACLAAAWLFSRHLDAISLGEDTARSLGQRVGRVKLTIVLLSVFLSALIVSVTGPIGFVGLVAPHVVKLAGFRRHAALLPASALCGALLLVAADTLTYRPDTIANQVPVGAVMALIGAPWLLVLALRMARSHGMGAGLRQLQMSQYGAKGRFAYGIGAGVLLLVLFLVLVLGCTLASGFALSPRQVLLALIGQGEPLAQQIVLQFRLPRMAGAILAGAMLAASGLLVQGAVRNPLADPSIVGISSGAGAGVLLLIVLKPEASAWQYSAAALIGAFAAAAITFLLGWRARFQPGVLIMIGIAVSAAFSALIQILILQTPYSISAQIWMNGSTYAMRWTAVAVLAAASVILLPLSWLHGRRLELLGFDDEASTGLGLRPSLARLGALALGVALSALAVSQVGTVGFIGLLAPHAAQWLVGHSFRRRLTLACLIGGAMLAGADVIGRVIMIPNEIPSGTVAAMVGAPYLFYLLWRSQRRG
ncbi:iron ABC transporter permease [Cohnella fermenti]|uniref:Iron ABC transporter permease n=1 Tax=Cohnella fermenti TaxID=2565925 RepID=A0A4S4BQ50_9BACL|nr:iron ABC transporter permease [Cohnella fermenti]THF76880.1 iron ABC transporter permease [Cohnella fermenti]